jgi:5,10-methylenetetrahydromethanopterin reductase
MMAHHTSRIGLGTGVTNPYSRHPVVTAKMIAMLDHYSRGRAAPGIGQGDLWQFDQLGIRHDRPLAALREAVLLIRCVLAGCEAGFAGEVYQVRGGVNLQWRGYRAHTPIFVGSRSPGGMAVAGEVADELHLPNCVAPEFAALARAQMQTGLRRAGRPEQTLPLSSSPQCAISADGEAARRYAQERIAGFIQWLTVPCQLLGIEPEEVTALVAARQRGDWEFVRRNVPGRYLQAFAVAGTAREVVEQLERLADLGFDHVTLNEPGPDLTEALSLLGREVLPHFR